MSVGVLQMVDSLLAGGAERMGVTLSNLLPRDRFTPHLCATRAGGPLEDFVAGDVPRLKLGRKGPVDRSALKRTLRYIRDNGVRIIHAHASSLFYARLVSMFPPYPKVVWHDHYGNCELNDRPVWLYRLATNRIGAVITVNEMLAKWAQKSLAVPGDRVWFIRNAVDIPQHVDAAGDLPGAPGKRILCVANLRPQKDHPTLVRAMKLVLREEPEAHLILVGNVTEPPQRDLIFSEISQLGLERHITYLGPRNDVAQVIKACDVAVLSSVSEGLPLVLLEYGSLRLPAVCTSVGQCPEVLDNGRAGILVPPSSPEPLAKELVGLLRSPERRTQLGNALGDRVQTVFGAASMIDQTCRVYDTLLQDHPGGKS
ncbi:MAG: glycosyltransferase [Bryobacteraceae bacterium]|nr:glycosyltransferase [Bryobacteraceae bacterium]